MLKQGLAAALLLAVVPAAAGAVQPNPASAPRTSASLGQSHTLAQCLVREFRPQVVAILQQIPGSALERARVEELRLLARGCAEAAALFDRSTEYLVSYDFSPDALRGALAEALYESDFAGSRPVRARLLARLPAAGAIAAESEAVAPDRASIRSLAFCIVASAPDAANALLALQPGSRGELETVRRFIGDFEYCLPPPEAAEINIATLRGFAAEALYRRSAAMARRQPVDVPTSEQLARRSAMNRGSAVIVPLRPESEQASAPGQEPSVADVRTLVEFARCVARRRPAEAEAVLQLDYSREDYDRTARDLASRSWQCRPDGTLRFSRVLFAGGLAEERLAALLDGESLERRLVAGSVAPRDGTEAIGQCLVRSEPAAVARLLATEPASSDETRQIEALTPRVVGCVAAGEVLRVSQPSLRAIAAIAAYRLVQHNRAAERPARN